MNKAFLIKDEREIEIGLANHCDLYECCSQVYESDFGRKYYPTEETVFNILNRAIEKDYIYVAKENSKILGFIWFSTDSMFGKFPYLNLIFVFSQFRENGVSNLLMEFFEEFICKLNKSPKSKIFLLVKSGNTVAKNLYVKFGYTEICIIKDLFRRGIEETLMMKEVINYK